MLPNNGDAASSGALGDVGDSLAGAPSEIF
jgi:hypothetical protein